MRKTLHKAGYSTLLATLMLAATSQAEPSKDPTLADIAKQLEALSKRLDTIELAIRVPDGSAFAMKKLQDDMLSLKKQMEALEQKTPYTAKRIDTSKEMEATIRPLNIGTAKVRFVNEWVEDVSVVVNGRAYEVMIGSELTVPIPAGAFSYQVLNLQRRPMTRTLEADKIWTVTINAKN
jgi:hypothetical protein